MASTSKAKNLESVEEFESIEEALKNKRLLKIKFGGSRLRDFPFSFLFEERERMFQTVACRRSKIFSPTKCGSAAAQCTRIPRTPASPQWGYGAETPHDEAVQHPAPGS